MEQKYELWLDESGRFSEESSLDPKFQSPSMVGGVLLTEEQAKRLTEAGIHTILDPERNHANRMTPEEKRSYVLPCLEKIRDEYGAHQVFFENAEYEDAASNRQLYLRMIAEGLLQLLQTLNAENESVVLHVTIAQRQDITAPEGQRRINEAEYVRSLEQLIAQKKKEHRILLDENSALHFHLKVATREKKLYFADFACNTRFIRNSKTFQSVKERVLALYHDAYIFRLSEMSSANFIRRSLTGGFLSDAIMELYTSRDSLNREQELQLIFRRMERTDYRLIKAQMKQFARDIISYTAKEDDFAVSEALLEQILKELVPRMRAANYPIEKSVFVLLLQLSDMLLREGNIKRAAEVLTRCREAQEALGDGLENLLSFYQLQEKEALLCINQYDYRKAAEIMQSAGEIFRSMMQMIRTNPLLQQRFPTIRSEYFGDALCMEIYARMFLQRAEPESYELLCRLSDEALEQYPGYEGELERHRQYRSHIEMERGNVESALQWLMSAKLYRMPELTDETILYFMNRICESEFEMSVQYYLMYYLLILCRAKEQKHPLAERMHRLLIQQKKFMEAGELSSSDEVTSDAVSEKMISLQMDDIQEESTGYYYHPMEIISWKYASFLRQSGEYTKALLYFIKAQSICFAQKKFDTLRITGLAVQAETICCRLEMGKERAGEKEYAMLRKNLDTLQKKQSCEATGAFLRNMQDCLKKDGKLRHNADADSLKRLVQRITF